MDNKSIELISDIEKSINSVVVGKADKVRLALVALFSGGHILLEDVPGVGKTTLAKAIAGTIGCDFGRIQFTPDTLPSDISGVSIYNMGTGTFDFMPGSIMHQIVLADEINRTSPKTQASLLEAMEEHQVTVDGKVHNLSEPFMVIATQNPVDFLGTYNLPEAQLDRFMMRISLGYPDALEEKHMAEDFIHGINVKGVKPVTDAEGINELKKQADAITIKSEVIKYIVDICRATREDKRVTLGVSPRAVIALSKAAQGLALIKGREYVLPDDVQELAAPVLAHRMVLSMEAKVNHTPAESIVEQIVKKVKAPV
ncbi:MAG: MoxR family ATPase [Lachnospiraceae bacterium]|nr:MoxR family ATPase [Lachnospiraceae bacterium]